MCRLRSLVSAPVPLTNGPAPSHEHMHEQRLIRLIKRKRLDNARHILRHDRLRQKASREPVHYSLIGPLIGLGHHPREHAILLALRFSRTRHARFFARPSLGVDDENRAERSEQQHMRTFSRN